ncbi:17301_t:CDS:2 [Rhizophagus irregularis]|nr:17301_t:CDS:2 [Rhizophagus irregularis]
MSIASAIFQALKHVLYPQNMAKVWREYFNENDVGTWSIFHFQQNWERIHRIHEGDYKQFNYEKTTDALNKSLCAIINKSLDTKKIKKTNSLLTYSSGLYFMSSRTIIKHNDNKAEGSASYVKDTLTSSSLEMVAGTESAGSNRDVNSSGYNRACTTSHQIDLGKEDDDQPL